MVAGPYFGEGRSQRSTQTTGLKQCRSEMGFRDMLVKASHLESCAACSGFHSRRGMREREQL